MALLSATPDERTLALIGAVARGFRAAGGEWPIWQYVDMRLAEQGVDGYEAYLGLPSWDGYRPVWSAGGAGPQPHDVIHLTAHGIHHSRDEVMNDLGRAFVDVLRVAIRRRLELQPNPTVMLDVRASGEDLTREANMAAETVVSSKQLGDLLHHEPATWSGFEQMNDSWAWNVSKARLGQFAQVEDLGSYLGLLERVVATRLSAVDKFPHPPMALPEALDYLDVTWRLATKRPSLLRLRSAAEVASLALSANSREDFEARCSALVDVIKQLDIESKGSTKQHKLDALDAALRTNDGIDMSHAERGIAKLRLVLDVRNGQQHRSSDAKAAEAEVELGLRTWQGNWEVAWNDLRSVVVDAFSDIRTSLRSLID